MSTRRNHRDHYGHDGQHRNHSGHGRGRDYTWWWIIGIIVGLALFGGHSFTGGTDGQNHSPSHRSTVCTKYFKGGC
jgi:hypothetical protein